MSQGRVLVVDDDPDILDALEYLLSAKGYDVIKAHDASEAIQAIASGDNPCTVDVVLTGLMMPGMNGEELVAYLRRQSPTIPIVVLTAYAKEEKKTQLLRMGVAAVLWKPFPPQAITDAIETAIAKARQPPVRSQGDKV